MSISVIIPPKAAGYRLSEWLIAAGYSVPSPCGGHGRCGKCHVKLISGTFWTYPIQGEPKPIILDAEGNFLACRAVCTSAGATVLLPELSGNGLVYSNAEADATESVQEQSDDSQCAYGIALDIGTTTLAAALVNRYNGSILSTASCLNPQQSLGADVVSRIDACSKGQLLQLQQQVLSAIHRLIEQLLSTHQNIVAAPDMIVVGNTTMLHLFCGISPEGMGRYPFTPVFTEVKELSGTELDLPVGRITLLPSISAFVGSDITAGMLACGMQISDVCNTHPVLLLDIGTNGEMVLQTMKENSEKLYAASTAAGPALEGANISCGMGGVAGAVSAIRQGENGEYIFRTVDDAPAVGLCGCGLIDFVAMLCREGIIDETGYLDSDEEENDGMTRVTLYGLWEREDGLHTPDGSLPPRVGTVPSVALTQKDIREFQLAKSAIRAGIEALLAEADMIPEEFVAAGGHVYLAGGMGYFLCPESAVRIGLLPPAFATVVSAVGNSALAGAIRALCNKDAVSIMSYTAQSCHIVELNQSSVFNDGFIEYMMFPEVQAGD